MQLEKANFFWHGSPLGLQEYVCISSFIRNGFDVCVYSYSDLNLPEGAKLHDASEILPASDLNKYTQGGLKANLAAFSDAFRYHVLRKNGGWWFDTDVLCLATVDQFANIITNKEYGISAGYQSNDVINCGVLYLDDINLLNKLINELENAGTEFEWGEIGPTLITRVISEANLVHLIEPEDCFYPISYMYFRRLYDPGCAVWCKSQTNGSLAVHLWNEFSRRDLIPKTFLPPEGSFLYEQFVSVCPELIKHPTLPFEIAQTLFDYADLKIYHQRLIEEHQQLERFEKKILGNYFFSLIFTLRRKLNVFWK